MPTCSRHLPDEVPDDAGARSPTEDQGRQALRSCILEGANAPIVGKADDAYFDALERELDSASESP